MNYKLRTLLLMLQCCY